MFLQAKNLYISLLVFYRRGSVLRFIAFGAYVEKEKKPAGQRKTQAF